MSEPVIVAEFGSRHEAELAESYLDAEGIPSIVSVDDSGGAFAGMSFSAPARISVRAEDADRARAVLEEAELS